ncbi:hypothetical protein BWGOE4_30470 [Bacillus mycoides]|uniref:hypothetical protein n=1 Tax=Bacillus cereus group TaxID=86661 RepID=UPI00027C0A48|nr:MULTISPECIES: hypothetical protein [Bacillus cereus group]EJV56482.1 hypothetical protein IEM_05183 [Bacillus cereus BAG6O-2]OFD46548.1 hypothetical protein BWGOE2_09140 [Bacillus mycoides]OFD49354.1 hypothetical protein BWGOE1_09980 [Bacillus mycoides]OFD57621.1 hypothetical protein BWGOE4_30470 [Bacillus mycoides]OFD63620.1 hypothetical protein BWGOE7_31020 [Bacillus mycoides]
MKTDKIASVETKKKMPLGRKIAIGAIGVLFSMNIIQMFYKKNVLDYRIKY